MKSIWKFPLEITDAQTIEMPEQSEIISVDVQGETPCLWALVDPSATKSPREFRIHGTGHPVADQITAAVHVGSFLIRDGTLVFHVFDVTTL